MISADRSTASGDDTSTYEVAELLGELTVAVEAALPDEIWIRGQIRNLSKSRKGHVYFDLVTPAPAEKSPEAVLPVVLFDWYRKIVNRILGPGAAGQMVDGVEVRIRGNVSVYKARGQLQLQMKTIDPAYTLSRLADERDRLLAELKAAGLLERNQALPLPTLPLRVGLVTSAGSAAEADFRKVLSASGIGWEILVVDTPVQGFGSEQRIAGALALAEQHGAEVIALVRGGGARTELAPFDSAAVAHAVTARSVPVLTGIGHEIDRSVADVVAHTACNTPTACAAALVERAGRFDRATLALWRGIEGAAIARLAADRRLLDAAGQRTGAAVAVSCRSARSDIRRLALAIDRAARHCTERARLRLEGIEAQARAYDPQRALERGWSITTDGAGRLLRSVTGIVPGATLRTRMSDGTVTSTADAVTPSETTGSDHD
ncbi:MAG: exodeoxyribonuclease VII large subunit [Acidimicrobiia bacterium]|nr:exodeoxyribonuclease VII large subunit [Acidimicrobiia bacterium]